MHFLIIISTLDVFSRYICRIVFGEHELELMSIEQLLQGFDTDREGNFLYNGESYYKFLF